MLTRCLFFVPIFAIQLNYNRQQIMELSGKIIQLLPLATGTGKTGTAWKKQDYVMEVPGKYPKKVCFNLWGEKIDQFNVQLNDEVKVSLDVESREYNGRWYTEVRAWKVEKAGAFSPAPGYGDAPAANYTDAPTNNDIIDNSGVDDDMPF